MFVLSIILLSIALYTIGAYGTYYAFHRYDLAAYHDRSMIAIFWPLAIPFWAIIEGSEVLGSKIEDIADERRRNSKK